MEQPKDVGKSQTSPEGTVQDVIIEINNYKITSPNDISTADKVGSYTDKMEKAADIGIKAIDMIDGIAEKVGFSGMKPVTSILKGVFSTAKDGAAKTKQTAQSVDKLHKANKLKKGIKHEQQKQQALTQQNAQKIDSGSNSISNSSSANSNAKSTNTPNITINGDKTVTTASQQNTTNNNAKSTITKVNGKENQQSGSSATEAVIKNNSPTKFQQAGETIGTLGDMSKGIFEGLGNTAGVIGDIASNFGATGVVNGANAAKGLAGALGSTSGATGNTIGTAASSYGKSSNLDFLIKMADTFIGQSSDALQANADAASTIAGAVGNSQAANTAKTVSEATKGVTGSVQDLFKNGVGSIKDTKDIIKGDGSTLDKVLGAGHSIISGLGKGVASGTNVAGSISDAAGADGVSDVLGKISGISEVVTTNEKDINTNLTELLASKKAKEAVEIAGLADAKDTKNSNNKALSAQEELVQYAKKAQQANEQDIKALENKLNLSTISNEDKKDLQKQLESKKSELKESKKVTDNAQKIADAHNKTREAERLADEANEKLIEAMQLTAQNAQNMDAETTKKIKEKIEESSRLNKESVEKAMSATKMAVEVTPELEAFKSTIITDVELMAADGSFDNPFTIFFTSNNYERCINKLREKLGDELTLSGEFWRDPALVPTADNKLYEVKAKKNEAFYLKLKLLTNDEQNKEMLEHFRLILNAKTLNIAGYVVEQEIQQKKDKPLQAQNADSTQVQSTTKDKQEQPENQKAWFYSYLSNEPLNAIKKSKKTTEKNENITELGFVYGELFEEYARKQDITLTGTTGLLQKISMLVDPNKSGIKDSKDQTQIENNKKSTSEKKTAATAKISKTQIERDLLKDLSIMISESLRFRFLQKNTAYFIKSNKTETFEAKSLSTNDKKLVSSSTKQLSGSYELFNLNKLLNSMDNSWQQISQSLWKKNNCYVSLAEIEGSFVLFPKRDLSEYPTEEFNEIYTCLDIVGMILPS